MNNEITLGMNGEITLGGTYSPINYDAMGYVPIATPKVYDPPLDPGIKELVEALNAAGVETYESCQGGEGHTYPEPTVRFSGDRSEGLRAVAVAIQQQFPVRALRRCWSVEDGELTGPYWEIALWRDDDDEDEEQP
jgi:hypothetical protein